MRITFRNFGLLMFIFSAVSCLTINVIVEPDRTIRANEDLEQDPGFDPIPDVKGHFVEYQYLYLEKKNDDFNGEHKMVVLREESGKPYLVFKDGFISRHLDGNTKGPLHVNVAEMPINDGGSIPRKAEVLVRSLPELRMDDSRAVGMTTRTSNGGCIWYIDSENNRLIYTERDFGLPDSLKYVYAFPFIAATHPETHSKDELKPKFVYFITKSKTDFDRLNSFYDEVGDNMQLGFDREDFKTVKSDYFKQNLSLIHI